MRPHSPRFTVAALALTTAFAAVLWLGPAVSARQAAFRSAVHTVAIYATVRDPVGRLNTNLDASAFRILDNGRPVDISIFSNEVQPFTAVILLDMSGSMLARVLVVRESTKRFIDAMSDRDRARIGSFGAEVAISPILTSDKAVLMRVLSDEMWPGGFTPLWRATLAAMASLDGESGRRVILVLSDGRDTDSGRNHSSPDEVKKKAVRDACMVYAIGIEGPGFANDLADVAEETGGGHFELMSDADIGSSFTHVAEELRHQYLLGFSPIVLDGKVHKLDVQVTGKDLKVRAAKSYVAREDK